MLAVIDCRTSPSVRNGLKQRGAELLPLPPHPSLPAPVASHPDMLIFFSEDAILTTKEYASIAKNELNILSKAANKPIIPIQAEVADTYPHDVLLNAVCIDRFLFAHEHTLAQEHFLHSRYTLCPVRQGYAKCSVIPVGENGLITADPSIAKQAKQCGLDVLQIETAPITLPGYDTGLIGGACSFAPYGEMKELFFCGDLESHPSATDICEFSAKHGMRALSLCDGPMIDLGTVFII